MRRSSLFLLALLLCCNASAQTMVLFSNSLDKPPEDIVMYGSPVYEYYVHAGVFSQYVNRETIRRIVYEVDEAFRAWGSPVVPLFLGLTDEPGVYDDGINTISFGFPQNEDGTVSWTTIGLTTKNIEWIISDEADILFTSLVSWDDLGITVSYGEEKLDSCSFRLILTHEVGHVLGIEHNEDRNDLMHHDGGCTQTDLAPSKRDLKKIKKAYRWLNENLATEKILLVKDTRREEVTDESNGN